MVLKNLFKIFKRVFGIKKSKRSRKRRPARKRTRKVARKIIRRKVARKTVSPKVVLKKVTLKKTAVKAVEIGTITHYFPQVRAAVVKLKKPLQVGEPVWIHGGTTDFRQTVSSLQINRKPIDRARAGQEIGLEVQSEVRPQDKIYRSQ